MRRKAALERDLFVGLMLLLSSSQVDTVSAGINVRTGSENMIICLRKKRWRDPNQSGWSFWLVRSWFTFRVIVGKIQTEEENVHSACSSSTPTQVLLPRSAR